MKKLTVAMVLTLALVMTGCMGGGRTVPAADTLWFDANRTIMTEISRRKPPDFSRRG